MRSLPSARLPPLGLAAIALGLAFWTSIAALCGLALWRERQQVLEQAMQSAERLAALMEEHTARTFQVVDLALQFWVHEIEEIQPPRHDPAVRQMLQAQLKTMPYVRSLYVIAPDGRIVHDTEYPATPDVSLADRGYFTRHRDDAALRHGIAEPLQSRTGTGWFVAATRRLGGPGKFQGVVVAAIQLRYFSDLYQHMGLGPGQSIVLYHRDGRLMAQYPPDDARVGQSFADDPLFKTHLRRSDAGAYIGSGPTLPFGGVLGYHEVKGEPLVVQLAHETRSVLGGWQRAAAGTALALLVLALLIAAGVVQFVRSQAQRLLAQERQVQAEKLEALGQLSGSVAHDFGNALGIISLNLELVKRLLPAGEERAAKALAVAQRAVQNGSGLTRQLLSFARNRDVQTTEVDLNDAVASAMPLLKQAAGSRVEVLTQPAPGPLNCVMERAQFETALVNLVINARDAMEGSGRITLTTRPCDQAETDLRGGHGAASDICLTVTDTGPGMTDAVRRRALEPFFTTKGESGTGLGLAQVYGCMRRVGGDVRIESAPSRGTSIHLYFPAVRT